MDLDDEFRLGLHGPPCFSVYSLSSKYVNKVFFPVQPLCGLYVPVFSLVMSRKESSPSPERIYLSDPSLLYPGLNVTSVEKKKIKESKKSSM